MKRIIAAVCILCLMLCACKGKQGEISQGNAGETLKHAADAMLLAGSNGVFAQCPAQRENANGVVKLSDEQLKSVLEIIKNAEIKPAAIKDVPGVVGELLLSVGENSIRMYSLNEKHAKYPGQTMLWVQISGAASSFVCDKSIYTSVDDILKSAVKTQDTEIKGEYMPITLSRGHDIPCGFVRRDNILISAYSSYSGTALIDFIDISSGKILSTIDVDEQILRLDVGTDGHIRYFTRYAVHYIDMKKQAVSKSYSLPKELSAKSELGFDVDEKGKRITYIRGNCVYTAKLNADEEKRLFTTDDVNASLTSAASTAIKDADAKLSFANARFVNKDIVAVNTLSTLAGMPNVAISCVDIKEEAAEPQHFEGVFGTLGGTVDYDEGVAMIQSEARLVFVDLIKGVQWQVPIVSRERAKQLPSGLVTEQVWEDTPNGIMHNVYVCKREGMSDKRMLLTTVGVNLEMHGTAENLVIMRNKTGDDIYILNAGETGK
ncbi:MAG: hypothetical protein RSA78_01715 [Oscillospiraceae bacterium]